MKTVFEKIIEKLESLEKVFIKGNSHNVAAGISRAIEIVKQEAEQFGRDTNVGSNGWIPCSERMPEDEQVVIACKYKSISILRYSTKTNHWYELSGNWWWSANMVTAWQPLPLPFRDVENG